jgi:hypothetical protein
MIGQRFGLLVVVRPGNDHRCPGGQLRKRWVCACDCGNEKSIFAPDLRSGHTRSCGCERKRSASERATHGMTTTAEYAVWQGMLNRCRNPRVKAFPLYGGRGIKVCERWMNSFEDFFADMGARPSSSHSIERQDPHGNYEPGNCIWATALEQANNKRRTRWVVYRGQPMSLCDAVRKAGSVIHHEAAAGRIFKCGWTVDDAVETPRLHESGNSKSRRMAYRPAEQRQSKPRIVRAA